MPFADFLDRGEYPLEALNEFSNIGPLAFFEFTNALLWPDFGSSATLFLQRWRVRSDEGVSGSNWDEGPTPQGPNLKMLDMCPIVGTVFRAALCYSFHCQNDTGVQA